MEDDFEREFAEELLMTQEEGAGISRKRQMEDSPFPFLPSDFKDTPHHQQKVPRLSSELPSTPEDGFERNPLYGMYENMGDTESSADTRHHQKLRTQRMDNVNNSILSGDGNKNITQCTGIKPHLDDEAGNNIDFCLDSANYDKVLLRKFTLSQKDDTSDVRFDDPNIVEQRSSLDSHYMSPQPRICVLKRAPKGAYVTVTSSEGDRIYLRLNPEKEPKTSLQGLFSYESSLRLLSVPFSELKDNIEEEKRRKLTEKSHELLQTLRSSGEEVYEKEGSQLLFDLPEDDDKDIDDHLLWVEKYSPKHYTELLSDDGINRTLLSWLKLWDEVVFGRPIALRGRPGSSTGTRSVHKGEEEAIKKTPQGKKFEKRMEYQDPTTFSGFEALDETGRPIIKLALLCGAPGLGKTTLAHIIAKHAGYNVVEMNASDDRSPEVFTHKIESSTQMQAVLTPSSKPNCLIIDEIDGAPTAAINILIGLVKKKNATFAKKMKGGLGLLSRPIICICNDQYAPSLRQLRQYALLLYFPPTVSARLASRLHQVLKREKMSAAMSTLMALCEKTDNDIRSCLNTLQFLSGKQKKITLTLVQGISVGQKDAQRSLFSLWKEIFQLPAAKKHTLNQGPLKLVRSIGEEIRAHGEGVGTNFARFYNILSAAMATGEHEKVANGLFENYLCVKFKDPNLEAISLGQDWIVFHNKLQQHIAQSQNFIFITYLPYLSVAFHFLFAAPSKAAVRYPNTSYEAFLQLQKNNNLLTSLLAEVPPCIRRTITPTLLVTEILPTFTEILTPTFRPVSTQLYSSHERQQLVDLVGTMISYSLTFRQDRGPDGQYTYVLEPNIEELTHFPGLHQKKQLSYSTKQLIGREIKVEKLRRTEVFLTKREHHDSTMKTQSEKPQFKLKEIEPTRQTFDQIKREGEQYAVDFFGRRISHCSHKKSGMKGSTSDSPALHSLWFKFNEGFSNAVRRPIHMKDLL